MSIFSRLSLPLKFDRPIKYPILLCKAQKGDYSLQSTGSALWSNWRNSFGTKIYMNAIMSSSDFANKLNRPGLVKYVFISSSEYLTKEEFINLHPEYLI